MAGKVIRQKYISRQEVRNNRATTLYVFGDNIRREGLGGQANAMRGEPNALGVPTKWSPHRNKDAFFSDDDWNYVGVRLSIISAFRTMEMFLEEGFNVVIPSDGLGTGLSELAHRAPRIFVEIETRVKLLEEKYP